MSELEKLFKNKKLTPLFLVGFVIVALFALPYLQSGMIISVDRIFLKERGSGTSGQELQGGYWRVTGTTQGSELLFLQLNHTLVEEKQVNPSDYPDDVLINGQVDFSISQSYPPYWYVPITKVNDVTIYPQTYGSEDTHQASQYSIPKLEASVWMVDTSQMRLYVPFSVRLAKTLGESSGSLVTDEPSATQKTDSQGVYWEFMLSYRNIMDTSQPQTIVFYNPLKPEEKFTLTFHFNILASEYNFNRDLIFVTPKDSFAIGNNVFNSYDRASIVQQLEYSYNDDWGFEHYWFGGGSKFLATVATSNHVYAPAPVQVAPMVRTFPEGVYFPSVTMPMTEGFIYNSDVGSNKFEYAGWYAPNPNDYEYSTGGFAVGSEWWRYRLPYRAQIYASDSNLRPNGYSVCDYLATEVKTPTGVPKPSNFQRVNPDLWSEGYVAITESGKQAYAVALPTGAATWLFTMDVSTELIDTVVVQQSYIDVSIENFSVDKTSISKDEIAYVTFKLKNNSPFGGQCICGCPTPSGIVGSCSISGGYMGWLNANEEKPVTVQIKNTGNLAVDKTETFTLKAVDGKGTLRDSESFQLTFKAGLNVPDTTVKVTCLNAENDEPLNGINVQIRYGGTGALYVSGTTGSQGFIDGTAILDLDKYTGLADITVSGGNYKTQFRSMSLSAGENSYVFRLINKGAGEGDWAWLLWLTIPLITVPLIYYVVKKKRIGKWR